MSPKEARLATPTRRAVNNFLNQSFDAPRKTRQSSPRRSIFHDVTSIKPESRIEVPNPCRGFDLSHEALLDCQSIVGEVDMAVKDIVQKISNIQVCRRDVETDLDKQQRLFQERKEQRASRNGETNRQGRVPSKRQASLDVRVRNIHSVRAKF